MSAILLIDEQAKEQIKRVLDYALAPENWFLVGAGGKAAFVPGDNPEFVVHLTDGFRAVFTISKDDSGPYRHLSISINRLGRYPSIPAVRMIAEEFGFTGINGDYSIPSLPEDWLLNVDKTHFVIVVAQKYGEQV